MGWTDPTPRKFMANRTRPNLVIGAVRGYSFEQLRPFIVSLKRTSFAGDLVLLWNQLSPETLAALGAQGVKLAPFAYRGSGALNSWSRFWPQIRPLLRCPVGNAFRRAVYRKILNLAFVRYLHALDFLETHRGLYQNILLTDVRDVIFQDDPFREPLPGEIAAFLESPRMTFGNEPLNDGWMLDNYGPEMAKKLRGKRISCCGTVAGTEAGMIDYLRAFVAEIIRLKSVAHGADTSVHNVHIMNARIRAMRHRFKPDDFRDERAQIINHPGFRPRHRAAATDSFPAQFLCHLRPVIVEHPAVVQRFISKCHARRFQERRNLSRQRFAKRIVLKNHIPHIRQ